MQAQSCQVCLNKAFDVYQTLFQNIYNENTDHLVKHYRNDCLRQVEQLFHLIIQSYCTYITTLEDEERYTQNTLRGIVIIFFAFCVATNFCLKTLKIFSFLLIQYNITTHPMKYKQWPQQQNDTPMLNSKVQANKTKINNQANNRKKPPRQDS